MCMMCEEESMYQAYLDYLVRKAAEDSTAMTSEEQALLKASGFACDPVAEAEPAAANSFSRMKTS
jgi:hypothetical protein